jgi:hypothetical protein
MPLTREAYELPANSENFEESSAPTLTPPRTDTLEGTESEEGTQGEQAVELSRDTSFGGIGAAEAGRRRWAKDRERKAALKDEDPEARRRAVIAQLEKAAAGGDVAAARELRSWLATPAVEGTDLDLASLSREKRRLFAAWLEEDAAKDAIP